MVTQSRSFGKRLLRGLGLLAAVWLLVSIGSVLLMRWLNPVTSAFMLRDRAAAWFNGDDTYRFAHEWVSWNQISAQAKIAVIASEDQKFADHWGFDMAAMQKAWRRNQHSHKIRGGSTISQQVAKNLYLWPERSYVRKGLEAYFTLLIELLWPKQRILEIYLNSAEFGKGTFGVQAASRRFFGIPAARLGADQAALLAAVLPAPKRLKADQPSRFVRLRQAWISRQVARLGGTSLLDTL